jgi:hypothetical protein
VYKALSLPGAFGIGWLCFLLGWGILPGGLLFGLLR